MTKLQNIIWEQPNEILKLPNMCKNNIITQNDLDYLLKIIIRNAAGRLSIKLEDFFPIVLEENKEFYDLKKELFRKSPGGITADSEDFKSLCNTLKLPINKERKTVMISINDSNKKDSVNEVFEMFDKLSNSEKINFILKLHKEVAISLTPTELIQYFSNTN